MKMDICIPKGLPIVRAEKLSWMADITFKPSSFRSCRELRHRKRHRDGDECNLFSRIRKWVGDDLVCSTSSQLSPSCQVQLSPKDSGVDLNSPPHRDDGNLSSIIMPDSRSEECERTVSLPKKRRRSSSSDNLLRNERMDLRKMTRESSKETKQPAAKSSKQLEKMETVSEMVTKKYTLVSNNTKTGPLVIKLRACPVESTQTTVHELEEIEPRFDYVESPDLISSTVHNQLTPVSHDSVSSNKTLSRSRSSRLSSVHQSKSMSTVVSSTTRPRKELKKKKTLPNPCVRLTAGALAGDCKDKPDTAAVESGTCLDVKRSKTSHFVDNNFTEKATGCFDRDHEEAHTRTFSPSAKRVGLDSKKYGRTRSNRETCVDEVNTSANNLKVIVSQDNSLPVVSSSCAVTEREEFISEKLPLGESPSLISNADDYSKDKKTTGFLSEFTKFIKSSDQSANASVSLRQGPGSYQVTRRHARIFRRSTLVPQLHRSLLMRKELSRVQDLHRNLGVSVKQESVHQVETTSNVVQSCKASKCTRNKNADISIGTLGQLESKIIAGDVLCNVSSPDLLFENEDDIGDIPDLLSSSVLCDAQVESEIIPCLLSATSLCEAQAGSEIIPDELLFNLPSTSSLCETKDASELSVLEEAFCNLPSTSLLCESSFISAQMQLTKLRHSVFWLLKTLVPQLQLPSRFDRSGPAVDEMVEVVCEELDSSRKQSTRSEVVSSEYENACLNSLIDLCRSPHDCLAHLRCKVLAMLSMLLGLDLDQSDDENLLESLLDAVVCANRQDDVSPNDDVQSSLLGTPELFRMAESDNERTFMPWEGETPEEVSSVDSFSDIPELLVEPERKFVTSDVEDFLEPPKLTAVDER